MNTVIRACTLGFVTLTGVASLAGCGVVQGPDERLVDTRVSPAQVIVELEKEMPGQLAQHVPVFCFPDGEVEGGALFQCRVDFADGGFSLLEVVARPGEGDSLELEYEKPVVREYLETPEGTRRVPGGPHPMPSGPSST